MDNNEVTENCTLNKYEVIGGVVFAVGLCLLTGRFFEYLEIPYGIGAIVLLIAFSFGLLGDKKRIVKE